MTFPISPAPGRHYSTGPGQGWVSPERVVPAQTRAHGGYDGASPSWTAPHGQDRSWWEPPAPQDLRQGWGHTTPPRQEPPRQEAWTPPPAFAPPSAWNIPDEPSEEEKLWADVRRQVAARVRSINAKHCQEAFDRLGTRQALSPHGVVLFYTAAAPDLPHGYQLHFVTRLFLQGPESDDLARVISDLTRSAATNISRAAGSGVPWDPRGPKDSMVNGGDMAMPRDAAFIGVGVSTLNTEQGDWYAVANAVRNQPLNTPRPRTVFDLRGVGLAMLIDGTTLRVERDPERRIGDDGVTCNKTLDAYRARHWNRAVDLTEQGGREIRAAWAQLAVLQHTLQDYLRPRRTS